ncbi:unnamed protein product [Brassica oleracea var. botrytis]
MCTIAAIESDMGWYYLSCKVCSKKVLNVPNDNIDEQGDEDEMGFHYYCVKCKVKNPRLMPRYKLHLVVLDNTGNSKFLLFDAIAMQILNHLCNELTGSNFEEMQDPEDILLALKDLVEKKFTVQIVQRTPHLLYFQHIRCCLYMTFITAICFWGFFLFSFELWEISLCYHLCYS